MRQIIVIVIFLILAWAFWQASQIQPPPPVEHPIQEPEPSQILHRGNGAEPGSLDPHSARVDSATAILRDLFEGLTSMSPDGRIIPGAAGRWTQSADGLVYTFFLRDNLRWSNGEPLTAADFVASFQRLVNPATASPWASTMLPIVNAEAIIAGDSPVEELGVQAIDARSLVIRLKSPTPYFLGMLNHPSTYPVNTQNVELHGEEFSKPGLMVSNGPYVLAEWLKGAYIAVKRNPEYWDNADTAIDAVYFHHVNDGSIEYQRYRTGELDFTYQVPTTQYSIVVENHGDELKIAPTLGSYFYGYNLTKPPFDKNPALRRALSLAVDRQAIVEKITGRGEMAAYGLVPLGVRNYTPQMLGYKERTREELIKEARQLYETAGYSDSNPLEVELRYNTSEAHRNIAIAIQSMWKDTLGFEAKLVNVEFRVLTKQMRERDVTRVFRTSWVGDYNDALTFLQIFHGQSGLNFYGYSNPDYDALLDRASVEPNEQQRRVLLQQAEALMLKDHPVIPIYYYVSKHLVKPYVKGWQDNIMNYHDSKHLSLRAKEPDEPQ